VSLTIQMQTLNKEITLLVDCVVIVFELFRQAYQWDQIAKKRTEKRQRKKNNNRKVHFTGIDYNNCELMIGVWLINALIYLIPQYR